MLATSVRLTPLAKTLTSETIRTIPEGQCGKR
jgi:hypothetical protein